MLTRSSERNLKKMDNMKFKYISDQEGEKTHILVNIAGL